MDSGAGFYGNCADYHYSHSLKFRYDTLVLPRVNKEITTESNGSTSTSVESFVETKAGEPFELYTLLWNNGADGMTTVQVQCDGEVIAEKIMAVTGGSWRVVEMTITINEPGEHTITVGDLTRTIISSSNYSLLEPPTGDCLSGVLK